MHEAFEEVPFSDPAAAEAALAGLLSGDRPNLAGHLAEPIAQSADPDTTLVRLQRFLEAALNPATYLDFLDGSPGLARTLVTLLEQSHFLTDILCRNPQYGLWLWEEAELDRARTRDEMLDELRNQVAAFAGFDQQCQSLRRFKRREFLRIAARDVCRHAPLVSVTEDLSNLADAALDIAITCAEPDLLRRFGLPRTDAGQPASFVILAFGKLGGRELNFSSDIDLVFLYSDEGETEGGESGSVKNAEYYQKLGQRIIRVLSERTDEGQAFRVDMRLRPYGRISPLAVGLEGALEYYETAGAAWERQALIKARPAAGDLDVGTAFIEGTRPFVYPRYFDDATLEDIRQIKEESEAQIRSKGRSETEVKLGRGGIRDIEFTIQMLQLLNGGRFEELQTPSTIEAIAALGKYALLGPFEADTLVANYMFLRLIEHRLQIEGSRQCHALPVDPLALDGFARRIGYESGETLMATYRDRAAATREILERFLATEGTGYRWILDILHPMSDGAIGLSKLAKLGFADPEKARDEIVQLYAGPSDNPHSLRVRQQFTAIAPRFLETAATTTNPNATLVRLGRIFSNLRAPGAMYDMIKATPHLAEYLVTLVVNSEYLTDILIRDPALFDTLGTNDALEEPATRQLLEAVLDELSAASVSEAALYRLHSGETLRIGLRDLFQRVDVFQIGRELTLLAEVCLRHVLEQARAKVVERFGPSETPFAVLALGKMGGRELGYGSDLDLVFVYEAAETSDPAALSEYFGAVASTVIRALKEHTRYGTLYDVDARLRPDGNKGMLTVSDTRLDEYYRHEAQAWERLALAKVRAVAGDPEFAERVEGKAQELAFGLPLTAEDLDHIEEIRTKIVSTSKPLDLKKTEGGIIEIEFATRMLQIRHASEAPGVKRADVAGALQALEETGALDTDAARTLHDAYVLFRRIENRIRMMLGRSASALPDSAEARGDLATRLEIDGDPATIVQDLKSRVHGAYIRILDTCRNAE